MYDQKWDKWGPGEHAGTFRGNALAMATGTATLRHIEAEGLVEKTRVRGEELKRLLKETLLDRYDQVGDVRGRGFMLGVELIDPTSEPGTASRNPPADGNLAARVQAAMLQNGVIVERGGRHGATIRLLPPLTTTDDELEAIVGALDRSLSECI